MSVFRMGMAGLALCGMVGAVQAEPRIVQAGGGVLNLQAEPHWWAASQGLVRSGARVEVVERQSGWAWVIHGGRSGWIEAKHLGGARARPAADAATPDKPARATPVLASLTPVARPAADAEPAPPVEEPVKKYLSVVYPESGTLNLRKGPGIGFEVIAPMERGSWVQVVAHAGNWAKLRHESGAEGWAARKYLVN